MSIPLISTLAPGWGDLIALVQTDNNSIAVGLTSPGITQIPVGLLTTVLVQGVPPAGGPQTASGLVTAGSLTTTESLSLTSTTTPQINLVLTALTTVPVTSITLTTGTDVLTAYNDLVATVIPFGGASMMVNITTTSTTIPLLGTFQTLVYVTGINKSTMQINQSATFGIFTNAPQDLTLVFNPLVSPFLFLTPTTASATNPATATTTSTTPTAIATTTTNINVNVKTSAENSPKNSRRHRHHEKHERKHKK